MLVQVLVCHVADDADAMLDTDAVLCLHGMQVMPYSVYRAMRPGSGASHGSRAGPGGGASGVDSDAAVRLYGALTGRACSARMLLYRE